MSTASHPIPRRGFWFHLAGILSSMSPARLGLWLLVVLPTLITVLYQLLIAAPIFVSESAFTVRLERPQLGGDVGMVIPGLFTQSGQQDQLTVNRFIQSRGMVEALGKQTDLKTIYGSGKADFVAALDRDVTKEEMVDYFRRMVVVEYDERAVISTLHIKAFSAEEAQALNTAVLEQAEWFVNAMSAKIRSDSIAFAQEQVAVAERELAEANDNMTAFRESNRNFDPAQAAGGAGSLILGLQSKLAEKRAELDVARGSMTAQNPRLRQLSREVAALERQVTQQTAVLTGGKPDTLSRQIADYTAVALKQEFATKRYGLSLAGLEAAQAEAGRKSIYLTRVIEPSLPDVAVEPRRWYNIASVFFLSLAGYGLLLLVAASIGDHIRK